MRRIEEVAAHAGLHADELYAYGPHIAKVTDEAFARLAGRAPGKQVLVTATTPTPSGEGKTTVAIGLAMALERLGTSSIVTLREPSLGPVFGLKGGATGGGKSEVLPMEEIDLHFTGDIHAVTAANNLLAALVDNHLHHGNALRLDSRRIAWRRALDVNDRALREVVVGLGGKANGFPRQDGFNISVASELMAILCLASDLPDLKHRLDRVVVGWSESGEPVHAGALHATGALTLLLKNALRPNIVQTSEGTPAIVHGGPFANIAHGTNSVRATRLAQRLCEVTVTEAGFASELGGEKFLDFVAPTAGFDVHAAVVVTTLRALKYHGGVARLELPRPNAEGLRQGLQNLDHHLEHLGQYGLPLVVALNRFPDNVPEELELVRAHCERAGVRAVVADPFGGGGEGCLELGRAVREVTAAGAVAKPLYPSNAPLREKLETIARRAYGADGVRYSKGALSDLAVLEAHGFGNLPVIVAKTASSISDDPTRLGRPRGFHIEIEELYANAGAGFVVAVSGEILLMPGLPKSPAAERIDVSDDGKVTGLF